MPTHPFAHLRCASAFSLNYGIMTPEDVVENAVEAGYSAIALTDDNNLFASLDFYRAARAAQIKPIMGVDAWIETDITSPDAKENSKLLLLAKNEEGYRDIMHWMSRAQVENKVRGVAAIKQSWLKEEGGSKNVVVLSGDPIHGELAKILAEPIDSQEDKKRIANAGARVIQFYQQVFPEFYVEISKADLPNEALILERSIKLADRMGVPLVATHPIMFPKRTDYFTHEVRACISAGQKVYDHERVSPYTREQYFPKPEEMEEWFKDVPDAIENAGRIATKCAVNIELGKPKLPRYPVPEGQTEAQYLRDLSHKGLEQRLDVIRKGLKTPISDADWATKVKEYRDRLDTELGIIERMGFPGYFLIVADFINWSKNNDIPVGPGRGSGAGSLVAFAMRITDIDPLPYNLLFERFLNPDRVSLPDFDVDFESANRDRVIEYVREKYGKDRVAQIATFGTMAAKASIKDVGRALGESNFITNKVAGLVPAKPGTELAPSIENVSGLRERYENETRIRRLLDIALQMEGLPRNVSAHAGGVVIAPDKIEALSPMFVGDSGIVSTQLEMTDVEAVGLVKFDFLGLKTLSILQKAERLINERPEFQSQPFQVQNIPMDDPDTFKLIGSGNNVAVFQLEGEAISETAEKMKPESFEDITALVAIYRPGPIQSGMVDVFIDCKHGKREIEYPHPLLEDILKPTYGVMVYQEQIMQAAQIMAGYSLGQADLLRRAMGKKKPEEMAKQRAVFEEGCAKNGVDAESAKHVFDLMEKFAEYGFNKSHSAAYAALTIQTAFIKSHYKEEFFAAALNIDIDKVEKIAVLIRDINKNNVNLLAPDINASEAEFRPTGSGVRYGLGAIKGVSSVTAKKIVEVRKAGGPFTDFTDFVVRMGRANIQKNQLEALIRAGAFDSLHANRASLAETVAPAIRYIGELAKALSDQIEERGDHQNRTAMLPALFQKDGVQPVQEQGFQFMEVAAAMNEAQDTEAVLDDQGAKKKGKKAPKRKIILPPPLADVPPWSQQEQMEWEKSALGFYFSGHPYSAHLNDLNGLHQATPLQDLRHRNSEDGPVLIAGVVEAVKEIEAKKDKKKMAFVTLGDGEDTVEIVVFSSTWEKVRGECKTGKFIGVEAVIEGVANLGPEEVNDADDENSNEETEEAEVKVKKVRMKGRANAVVTKTRLEDKLRSGVEIALTWDPQEWKAVEAWAKSSPVSVDAPQGKVTLVVGDPETQRVYEVEPRSEYRVGLNKDAVQKLKSVLPDHRIHWLYNRSYQWEPREPKPGQTKPQARNYSNAYAKPSPAPSSEGASPGQNAPSASPGTSAASNAASSPPLGNTGPAGGFRRRP